MKKVTIQEVELELKDFPQAYALRIDTQVYNRGELGQRHVVNIAANIAVSYHESALVNFKSRIVRLSKPDLKAWLVKHEIIPERKEGPEYIISKVELTVTKLGL